MITILYIAAGALVLVVAFFGLQMALIARMQRQKGKPAPALEGKPGQRIKGGKPALFYFYSPSCGACRAMTPAVKKLAKTERGVFPIDLSQDMDTGRRFGVMATPTTVFVDKGVIQQVLIGPQPPKTLSGLMGQ